MTERLLKRKSLFSKTKMRSWAINSKSSAWLSGKDYYVHCPGVGGLYYTK